MAAITVSRRALLIIGVAVVALLVTIVILLSVLLTTMSKAQTEADYRRCLDNFGTGSVATGESLETYSERVADAAAFCSR